MVYKLDFSLIQYIREEYFENRYYELSLYLDDSRFITFSYNSDKYYDDEGDFILFFPEYAHLEGNVFYTDVKFISKGKENGNENYNEILDKIKLINATTTLENYDFRDYTNKVLRVCVELFNALKNARVKRIIGGYGDQYELHNIYCIEHKIHCAKIIQAKWQRYNQKRHAAASKIQCNWRHAIANPRHKVCRTRLMREICALAISAF